MRDETEIVGRFVSRARKETDYAPPSGPQLTDQIPRLLRELVTYLDQPPEGARRIRDPARLHGVQRHGLGYDVANLVREYGFLHDVILEVASERGAALSWREHRLMASFLSDASVHSVVAYVQERDEELARAAARHYSFIAHELRNPLQTAVLAARAIGKDRAPPKAALERLQSSLGRLGALIDDSLVVATLRADRAPQREAMNACELVHQVVEETLPEAFERSVNVRAELPSELPVRWDPKLMHSALTNLVRNAVKFTRADTEVIIRGHEEAELAILEVEDRCGGLTEDYRQLFEPDVQKGEDRTGFGLGLEIAERAAKVHGGEIRVRNVEPDGCVFALAVPSGRS